MCLKNQDTKASKVCLRNETEGAGKGGRETRRYWNGLWEGDL